MIEPEFEAQSQSGYVSALNPNGSELLFSTFFSGSNSDMITSLALDQQNGMIALGGHAGSPDLPGVFGIYQKCLPTQDYLGRIATDGTALLRTTAIAPGNPSDEVSVAVGQNDLGLAAVPSGWAEVNFQSPDSRIACLAESSNLTPLSAVAPGQLLTILGSQLASDTSAIQPVNGVYPTSGPSASVTVNGLPAPILYESPEQINVTGAV